MKLGSFGDVDKIPHELNEAIDKIFTRCGEEVKELLSSYGYSLSTFVPQIGFDKERLDA